jgi:hypothetical protein
LTIRNSDLRYFSWTRLRAPEKNCMSPCTLRVCGR